MPLSLRTIQTPYFSLKRSSTLPETNSSGKPALKVAGGSKSTFGNMKRVIAPSVAKKDAVYTAQAAPSHGKNSRRLTAGKDVSAAGLTAPPAAAAALAVLP